MSITRFLLATFFTLSITSATVFADTTNQTTSPATGAPDNSTTVTTPATDANSATNSASDNASSTVKKLQTVNINTADAKTLQDSLKGIGAKRAAAIIAYRTQNGPFKSADDLTKIKGISQKVVNQNRDHITLS